MRTITRNVQESDLLLLPSTGEEAGETAALMATKANYERGLERELTAQMGYVVDGKTSSIMLVRADSLPTEGLLLVANGLLKASANLAVSVQVSLLSGVGIHTPVTYAENIVAQWANRYDNRLVRGINRNSRDVLRGHITQWTQKNEDLPDLVARLTPHFGKSRAALIGTTEATRAYTEGTFTAWEGAGFNRRPSESNRPPAHPRCRCFVALAEDSGGWWNYIWYTVNDALVCPICEPKHLTSVGSAGRPN